MVAHTVADVTLLFPGNGMALSVISRGVVARVFLDVIDRCAAPQNPSGAILCDGSSDRSVGCPELRGEW